MVVDNRQICPRCEYYRDIKCTLNGKYIHKIVDCPHPRGPKFPPQDLNRYRKQAKGWTVSLTPEQKIAQAELQRKQNDPDGPGSILRKKFALMGIKSSGCSGCETTIKQMNVWGPDGCENNINQIVDSILARAGQKGWFNAPVLGWVLQQGARVVIERLVRESIGNVRAQATQANVTG